MRIHEILKEAEYNAPYADSKDYQPMTPEEWSALMYIKPKYDPEKRGVLLPDNVWKIQVKRPEWIPPDKWLDWVKQGGPDYAQSMGRDLDPKRKQASAAKDLDFEKRQAEKRRLQQLNNPYVRQSTPAPTTSAAPSATKY